MITEFKKLKWYFCIPIISLIFIPKMMNWVYEEYSIFEDKSDKFYNRQFIIEFLLMIQSFILIIILSVFLCLNQKIILYFN